MAWQAERNKKVRIRVYEYLDTIELGQEVIVTQMTSKFSNRSLIVMPKQIANFMKERSDFISKGNGIWLRIATVSNEGIKECS